MNYVIYIPMILGLKKIDKNKKKKIMKPRLRKKKVSEKQFGALFMPQKFPFANFLIGKNKS